MLVIGDSFSYSRDSDAWCAHSSSLAQPGWSNVEIWQTLKKHELQPAVIQLSTLNRVPPSIASTKGKNPDQFRNASLQELNTRAAKSIIARWKSVSIIWSPWPDYETWPDVLYWEDREECELWCTDKPLLDNHLTRLGNDRLKLWLQQQGATL
jgi:hypothetical protein